MDNGFEYIIYIVLGVIFVLAQIARRKKKVTQAQSADSEEIESKPSPTFLEQMLGIPEQKPVAPSQDDFDHLPPEDLNPSSDQSGPRVSASSEVNENTDVIMARPKTKPAGYQRVKRANRPGFDLRKAVIYQVVLERKNF